MSIVRNLSHLIALVEKKKKTLRLSGIAIKGTGRSIMSSRIVLNSGFFVSNLVRRTFHDTPKLIHVVKPSISAPKFLRSSFFSIPKLSFQRSSIRTYPTWRDLNLPKSNFRFGGGGYYNRGNGIHQLVRPAAFFVGSTVLMYYTFPYLFKIPPFNYFNSHPQMLVYAIILANIGVYFLWMTPRLYPMMMKHFLLQKPLRSLSSMVGSTFSHQESWHLGFNMLMLYSFGTSFASAVGPSFFLLMYLSSGIFASLVSLAVPVFMRASMIPSLGASGSLFSLFATVAYLFPKTQLSVFFIPFPGGAWMLLLLFTGLNAAGMVLRWGGMDYAAHLGGTAIGVFYGWFITEQRKKKLKRQQRRF